ncbi:GAF domain-containing protein [Nocardioides zeae]|uniref:GAF domain-containing protein n=1 Tax=Nocardioides zeae TaxID=1457234 RepID=A0A6P0HJR3_9ACTN|nr:GAF domain-containing protein [Nocardioides zeae]
MPTTFLDLLYAEAARSEFDALVEARVAQSPDPAAAAEERRRYDVALRLRDLIARQRLREAELSALYDTASDLSALRDVDAVLAAIVRRARQLLQADMTYLSLNDEGEGASYMRVTDGALTAEFRKLRLPLGDGLLGLVAQTGAPYFTPDYQHDERFRHRRYIDDAVAGEQIRAILGVPLLIEGRVIGTLLATHRTVRPFPPEEVSLLTSFAAHAAVALENARLFAELDAANRELRGWTAVVEAAALTHDRLTDLLLRGGGLADVVAVLTDGLGAGVGVLDAAGTTLAGDPGPFAEGDARDEAVARAVASGRGVATAAGHVAPALAGQEHLATLVVHGTPPLDASEERTLERAAMVAGLVVLFDRSVADAEERVGGALLADLLRERPREDAAHLRHRARLQGAALAGASAVAALDVEGLDRPSALRSLARVARRSGGLAADHDGRLVALLPVGDDGPRAVGAALAAPLEAAGAHVTVGVATCDGDVHAGAARRALTEAVRVLETLLVLGRRGEVADPAALGVTRLLLGTAGPESVGDFVTATLGAVLEHDRRRGTDLRGTLEAWFATGGVVRATAARLHLHPNTVTQRLDRVGELLGTDWRAPERALDLQLALRVVRLRRGEVSPPPT